MKKECGSCAVFFSDDRLGEFFPADKMEMQMHHALASVRAAIVHDAITVVQSFRLCDLCNRLKAFGNIDRIIFIDLLRAGNMHLRHNENMHGSLGIDVPEGKNIFVFIHLVAGDLPRRDGAEKAIVQHFIFSFQILPDTNCSTAESASSNFSRSLPPPIAESPWLRRPFRRRTGA